MMLCEFCLSYDPVGGVGIQTQYYDNGKIVMSGSSNLASKVLDLTLFDINSGKLAL